MALQNDTRPSIVAKSLPALRVLSYSNLFPNQVRPNFGIFIKNRLAAYVAASGSKIDVISPVPYFPRTNWPKKWAKYGQLPTQEHIDGFDVFHPRYVVIPKMGMGLHGLSMYWGTAALVKRLHQKRPYHLIDAHWIYPDGWSAVHLGKKLGIPVVLSARGNDINEYLDFPKIRPKIKWCLEQCSHIVSVCQGLKDLMVDLGIPDSKISVIGNGIDSTKFYPIAKVDARKKQGVPIQQTVILSVGILEPRKGHHLLIEALHILRARGEDVPALYIVGSGPFRKQLENLAKKFEVWESVHFVGEVPHRDLYEWYSLANLFCLASDREGWPNVLLEAMACGTPVVATNVFGVPEIVKTKDVGLLVNSRTSEALANTISEALKVSWNSDVIIQYANQYTWGKVATRVGDVFGKAFGASV